MRIAFYTLGCKVNQYETQILTQIFAADGYDVVSHTDLADVYVVNSCTVTATGDRKTRQMLRQFKARNPAAKVVLSGCFPQAFPDAAERLPEADVITGARGRGRLVELVARALATGERIVEIQPHERGEGFERMQAGSFAERTRAFVKIEDGCERYCAYCIIPTARGPVRSKPPEDLRDELQTLAAAGYREAVLVGINLSSYGKELGLRLIDAVETAAAVDGIERVRLGSLEPELLTGEDISRMAALPKVCPQFHLSLQSGCDATLKRMNRRYTTEEYYEKCCLLRKYFQNPALTTDIIVGFPGETEEEFAASMEFADKVDFYETHIFKYSRREGTKAAAMADQIPESVKAERSQRMIELGKQKQAAYERSFLGQEVEVLLEEQMETGGRKYQVGHTREYLKIALETEENLQNCIRKIRITDDLQIIH